MPPPRQDQTERPRTSASSRRARLIGGRALAPESRQKRTRSHVYTRWTPEHQDNSNPSCCIVMSSEICRLLEKSTRAILIPAEALSHYNLQHELSNRAVCSTLPTDSVSAPRDVITQLGWRRLHGARLQQDGKSSRGELAVDALSRASTPTARLIVVASWCAALTGAGGEFPTSSPQLRRILAGGEVLSALLRRHAQMALVRSNTALGNLQRQHHSAARRDRIGKPSSPSVGPAGEACGKIYTTGGCSILRRQNSPREARCHSGRRRP